jgi:hypothetical protein
LRDKDGHARIKKSFKRRYLYLFFVALLVCATTQAQTGYEVFLFDLALRPDGMAISRGINVSQRLGYDNQPHFHPDRPLMYYIAADSTGSTDIMVYDYDRNKTIRFQETTLREYSPTVTPDHQYISCIVQGEDGAQDLAKYPVQGGPSIGLINNLKIGYHAWIDSLTVLVFVLGEPNTLHRIVLSSGDDKILAENIGRSLHTIPATNSVSFVQKESPGRWWIKKVSAANNDLITLAETLPHREDLAWTPDQRIVMSDGKKLYYRRPGIDAEWKEIQSDAVFPHDITRISIHPKGNKIALVVGEHK